MSHAPTNALRRRHQLVREAAAAERLDAVVVTSLPNILYLSNFGGSSAIVVVTPDRFYFVTDFRYVTVAAEMREGPCACPGFELVTVDGSYDATVASLLGSLAAARVGFEAAHLTVSRHQWLATALQKAMAPHELVPTEGLVERLRMRKDSYEVETLREAARRLSAVALGVFEEVRSGRSEREIALAIDWRIRDSGPDEPAGIWIRGSGAGASSGRPNRDFGLRCGAGASGLYGLSMCIGGSPPLPPCSM